MTHKLLLTNEDDDFIVIPNQDINTFRQTQNSVENFEDSRSLEIATDNIFDENNKSGNIDNTNAPEKKTKVDSRCKGPKRQKQQGGMSSLKMPTPIPLCLSQSCANIHAHNVIAVHQRRCSTDDWKALFRCLNIACKILHAPQEPFIEIWDINQCTAICLTDTHFYSSWLLKQKLFVWDTF